MYFCAPSWPKMTAVITALSAVSPIRVGNQNLHLPWRKTSPFGSVSQVFILRPNDIAILLPGDEKQNGGSPGPPFAFYPHVASPVIERTGKLESAHSSLCKRL